MNEIKQYKNARFANRMQRKAEQPLPESALSAACVCKSQLTDGRKTRGHYTAASHLRQTVFPNLSDKPTEDGRLRRMFTVQDKIHDLLQHLNCTRDLTAVEDFSIFYLHHTGTMNGVLFLRATKVFFPIKLK